MPSVGAREVFVFRATLVGFRGIRRTLAVRSDQTLADLSDLLRFAFGWDDEHLYAFWLDGRFWSANAAQYAHPFQAETPDPFADFVDCRETLTAEVELATLELSKGQKLAYVFDFGDEWRVLLTIARIVPDDGASYPAVIEAVGEAPPQYPEYEDEEFEEVA